MDMDTFKVDQNKKDKHAKGQGLVETAILFPLLLIVLSGLLEFGFILNDYLAMQDVARNSARFGSDGLFYARDEIYNCTNTRDFYRQVGCIVNQELAQERPENSLNFGDGFDDIVVSGFSIARGSGVSARHPGEYGQMGWSGSEKMISGGSRNQTSTFSGTDINTRLNNVAPSTGFIIVEIFYHYDQKLKLPWITAFINDPLPMHNYALMPLVSAEPTPTPIP